MSFERMSEMHGLQDTAARARARIQSQREVALPLGGISTTLQPAHTEDICVELGYYFSMIASSSRQLRPARQRPAPSACSKLALLPPRLNGPFIPM